MKGRIFWGTIFITFGVLLMLDQIGLLPGSAYSYLWPMILIGIGVVVLYNALHRRTVQVTNESLPLHNARSAHVAIKHAAGELELAGGAPAGILVNGEFAGGVDRAMTKAGDQVDVTLKLPNAVAEQFDWLGANRGLAWDVHLNQTVPLALSVETGASRSHLDLSDLQVESFDLRTGAGSVDVTMPSHAGKTEAHIDSGIAEVNVNVPAGVAAHIHGGVRLGSLSVNEARFPKHEDGFASSDYQTAQNQVDISIQSAIGAVTVR